MTARTTRATRATRLVLLSLVVTGLWGQQPPPAPALPLPDYFVSLGGEYNRYTAPHPGADLSFGIRIGNTSVYSYTTLETALAHTPTGAAPPASSIRTGAATVLAQSPSGRLTLFVCGQAGATTGATTSGSLSGCLGVPIKLGRSDLYLVPMGRFNAVGSGVQIIGEIQLLYGFRSR